jgi:hypothetical protein
MAVDRLLYQADAAPATFDAYKAYTRAIPIAAETDTFLAMLSVLDPAKSRALDPTYGGVIGLQTQAEKALAAIVVSVQVDSDSNGRLAKAFADCFSGYGFKTVGASGSASAAYDLKAEYIVEEVGTIPNSKYEFARWTLNAALIDKSGQEIIPWSGSAREGGIDMNQAKTKCFASAIEGVSTDFKPQFGAYLDGLGN